MMLLMMNYGNNDDANVNDAMMTIDDFDDNLHVSLDDDEDNLKYQMIKYFLNDHLIMMIKF